MSTYEIISSRMDDFITKIKKLNNKAIKLGLEPIQYEHIASRKQVNKDPITGAKFVSIYNTVNIIGTAPIVNGYKFIAKIEHHSTGNIISKAPGIDYDLPEYFRSCEPDCVHCGIDRKRNNTFILQNDDKFIQVGRNCLADFIRSPDVSKAIAILHLYEVIDEYADDCYSDSSSFRDVDIIDFLAVVRMTIRNCGWVSKKQAQFDDKTSTSVLSMAYCSNPSKFDVHPSEEDYEVAKKINSWVLNMTPNSDYEYNIKASFLIGYVGKNNGLIASAVPFYNRANDLYEKKEKLVSNYFGDIGSKVQVKVKIFLVKNFDTQYGTTTLVGFVSDNGNVFKWFASGFKELNVGDEVIVTGTVKTHSEYNGIKETLLTRCKLKSV